MPQFETPVVIPESIVAFFAAFEGKGKFEFAPGQSRATLTVEADDLWDAAMTLGGLKAEVNSALPNEDEHIDFEKPKQLRGPRKPKPETKPEPKQETKPEPTPEPTPEPEAAPEEDSDVDLLADVAEDDGTTEAPMALTAEASEAEAPEKSDDPDDDELDALLNM